MSPKILKGCVIFHKITLTNLMSIKAENHKNQSSFQQFDEDIELLFQVQKINLQKCWNFDECLVLFSCSIFFLQSLKSIGIDTLTKNTCWILLLLLARKNIESWSSATYCKEVVVLWFNAYEQIYDLPSTELN